MSSAPVSFQTAHRLYVKSLYKRSLQLSLDWYIRRDLWRQKALDIRHQFELNKNVTSPKELQQIFAKTEKQLEDFAHPDPYKCMCLILQSGSQRTSNV
jgi:NADH dehydrogenase (ubiquinone) 1 beta subcomplex subunit 9